MSRSNVIARLLRDESRGAGIGAACMFFLAALSGADRMVAHADDGKIPRAVSDRPITRIVAPEQDLFAKRLDYQGLPIKGEAMVADEAFYEARRRIHHILRNNPQILKNLLAKGVEVRIAGRNQAPPDLPAPQQGRISPPGAHTAGPGHMDRIVICGEESLLDLCGDNQPPRNDFWREFTRAIFSHGISPSARGRVEETFAEAIKTGLWHGTSGSSSAREYLAAVTMWHVEGQGDVPRNSIPAQPGREWLKTYDPAGYQLVDDLLQGRWDAQPSAEIAEAPVADSSPALTPSEHRAGGAPPAHHGHDAMRPWGQGKSVIVNPEEVLEIKTSGVELTYDITEIRARAGDRLTIRYNNAESDMAHNIVVVKTEEDIMAVGIASLQAHRNEYIPEAKMDRIIAFSKLAYPGETVEFTFVVPPPGIYPYICTYAGHFTMMQGRLISIEADQRREP